MILRNDPTNPKNTNEVTSASLLEAFPPLQVTEEKSENDSQSDTPEPCLESIPPTRGCDDDLAPSGDDGASLLMPNDGDGTNTKSDAVKCGASEGSELKKEREPIHPGLRYAQLYSSAVCQDLP